MPIQIPNKGDFQPSSQTLTKWLATRKPTLKVGGVIMPGFFSDTGNSSDYSWVMVGAIGEIVGLLTILYGGMKSGGIFLILASLASIMFIVCDIFFAYRLHRHKAQKCILRSRKLLESDNNKAKILDLELQLNKGKFEDFLYQTGIIFIAIVKIFGIILLGVFNNLALYIPFAIIYLIVAYVHLRHTGYALEYFKTERAITEDYEKFAGGQFIAQNPKERIKLKRALYDVPIKHVPHEIIEEDKLTFSYLIKVKGVLTDDDIINLINGQDSDLKIELFKACRNLQLESYLVG